MKALAKIGFYALVLLAFVACTQLNNASLKASSHLEYQYIVKNKNLDPAFNLTENDGIEDVVINVEDEDETKPVEVNKLYTEFIKWVLAF